MSSRLGVALARHILGLEGQSRFVLVEGVEEQVALAMAGAWDDGELRLAIASRHPLRFGERALSGVSGTGLRNRGSICIVLCEGAQLADRQSLRSFESVAPSDLLRSHAGLSLLARVAPSAPLDGPVRAVRGAIIRAGAASRPSASAVAAYFDRCAAGEDPLRALPALGAFPDHAAGGRAEERRVLANLELAARRRSEQLPAPAELRRRAARVLAQRPGVSRHAAEEEAERVRALLQQGSDAVLEALTYDEALEILDQRHSDLTGAVKRELRFFRSGKDDEDVAWERYEKAAEALRDPDRERAAATELLGLDRVEGGAVFEPGTRRRLERLLKERVLSASRPSCPELAFLRAALALDGIGGVELVAPTGGSERRNRSAATQDIALACARLRLGRLLRELESEGASVDGALLLPASISWPEVFEDAQLGTAGGLPTVQLRLRSRADAESRMVSWRPDLDDVATLRAVLAFAEEPALSLRAAGPPTLDSFCAADAPTSEPLDPRLRDLGSALQGIALEILENGLAPEPLFDWTARWTTVVGEQQAAGRVDLAEALGLAGALVGEGEVALTPLAPLKAEWLAQYLDALRSLFESAQGRRVDRALDEPLEETAAGVAQSTAAHYPSHLRVRSRDRVLLPSGEGRIWSVYGVDAAAREQVAGDALGDVIARLVTLQPDVAGHLRCLAYGPGAATLVVEQAVALAGRRIGRAMLRKIELFCVGGGPRDRPSAEALAVADEALSGESERPLELRYLRDLQEAASRLQRHAPGEPAVHLAVVTGLSAGGGRLTIESPEVDPPPEEDEVLFAPRTWTRPRTSRRLLLMPPVVSEAGGAWLRLMNAIEDDWPEPGGRLRVPELRTASGEFRDELLAVHDLALWVATLDPYATRDSLTFAMDGQVAILHQDRRLGGDSPLSLVISQKSGGPADRAVGRSLLGARIVTDFTEAVEIGADLRRVASEGYGILALEAATTGAGINELVGHVVAFSLLATRTTPWPLPPGCRILLVSLDDYKHWFPSKRADLLVLALDEAEEGVHVAAIEVKARRSDADPAARDALDQLRHTLHATRDAAYPEPNSPHSRLWLNRLAEAACAVARESDFRLTAKELRALEAFRAARGTLEWAGLGLVFGPNQPNIDRHHHHTVAGDRIPIVIHSVQLTKALLREAAGVRLSELRTVEAERAPLDSGRIRRRPERGVIPDPKEEPEVPVEPLPPDDVLATGELGPAWSGAEAGADEEPVIAAGAAGGGEGGAIAPPASGTAAPGLAPATGDEPGDAEETEGAQAFVPPVLGWDIATGEPVLWRAAGEHAELDNGHTEIWGASGRGKTQFTMMLLAQLAARGGARFGIADFKNDYSGSGGDRFPERTGARFVDLWNDGAPFNPLALGGSGDREVLRAVIEMRDIVEVATQSFTRLGIRQKDKLRQALERSYEVGRSEGRWPTLLTLDDQLDDDLRGVIGDLTRHEIFRDGPPLGQAVEENLVFGLHEIPGNGLTTVLAAGFILSALHLRMQSMPQVANTIRYLAVVDEAHRVAAFKAVKSMLREGRSKGLAVLLATQQPGDLPDEVATNANTRICFGLPDAVIASAAARRLDASDPSLADQIRTLDRGEAFVSLGGATPRLLRMAQFWHDREELVGS